MTVKGGVTASFGPGIRDLTLSAPAGANVSVTKTPVGSATAAARSLASRSSLVNPPVTWWDNGDPCTCRIRASSLGRADCGFAHSDGGVDDVGSRRPVEEFLNVLW